MDIRLRIVFEDAFVSVTGYAEILVGFSARNYKEDLD